MRPTGLRPIMPLVAILVVCATAHAGVAVVSAAVEFERADLTIARLDGRDVVRLRGAATTTDIGFPELPLKVITFALQEGMVAVGVDAEVTAERRLDGSYDVRPVQPQVPLSRPGPMDLVAPDPVAYASSAPYPERAAALLANGMLAGRPVASVAVFPVRYAPAEGRLTLCESVRVTLTLAPDTDREPRRPLKDGAAVERLRRMVVNPADVSPAPAMRAGGRSGDAEYLIITSSSLASTFQPLADWKTQKGIPAQVLTTTWVYANYGGVDNQERIRNCIIDHYENHGTQWVLLGGDTNVVPARIAYAMTSGQGTPGEDDLRCDLYYSDLDGTWNADGDGTWGEVWHDNVDMYADVFVGRAPVDNTTEATRFVSKTLTYQGASGAAAPATDYQTRALFLAEVLWTSPYTDGGICKDMIDDESVPERFDPISKLYQTNGLLTKSRTISELNAGRNIVNHVGHANWNVMSIGSSSLYSSDFDNLTNVSRYGIFYSIGCWAAAIDYDAIAEHWVHAARGGVAFVGNSRYGWGSPGNPGGGTSDEFDREFFRQLFNEGVDRIGMTHAAHKDALVGLARTNDYYRYCLYELNLLGDPEMTIWTQEPVAATVNHVASVPLGEHPFVATVSRAGAPVAGAVVHLSGAGVSETATTGPDGVAWLLPAPSAEGPMTMTVTGQGILALVRTIQAVDRPADTEPPARVAQLVVSDPFDTGGVLELSWAGYEPPADFACYRIYRSETALTSVAGMTPVTGAILPPDETSWTDTGVAEGVPYWYAVTALDLSGNEDPVVAARGPIAASQNARILVWDADDGDTPFDGVNDDFTAADGCEAPWIQALDAIGELYVVTKTLPSNLAPFELIVYLGGVIQYAGQGGVNVPMTADEIGALTASIDAGGSVYVEEPNFGGTYYVNGTPASRELWSRFHAVHAAGSGRSIGNVASIMGEPGQVADGQSFAYDYKGWPDQMVGRVTPDGSPGASRLWSDQASNGRGTVYAPPGTGARLYMVPVLLGGMTDAAYPSTRTEYVRRILADLGLIGTSGVAEAPVARPHGLEQNAPNPFNPTTTIRYAVGADGARVRLAVYDVAGRLVTVLADCPAPAGRHEARWDGRDARGDRVSSGVYFCRLTVDGWSDVKKMTILK